MSQECQQPQAHPARCGCEQKKPYPDRLCHIEHNVHPYRCGCLKGDAEAQRRFDAHQRNVSVPAPGVEMEVLPQHVMKLEAERLWGGDGEYAVSFEKAGWLQQCRQRGGTFLLYTAEAFKPIVTRLQAELAASKAAGEVFAGGCTILEKQRDALKDKLHKANLCSHDLAHANSKLQSELIKARELLAESSAWIKANSCHGTDAIDLWDRLDSAHQSVPGTKGDWCPDCSFGKIKQHEQGQWRCGSCDFTAPENDGGLDE